jgi:glycine dehydrogenase subunit 1
MPYIVNTDAERGEMLKVIGAGSFEDLLVDIPKDVRISKHDLPPGGDELTVTRRMDAIAAATASFAPERSFAGGGLYRHFIPAVVPALVGRSEFVTAYTPYQPEISQGMLQAIFEYQSYICMLTGMEVSNASSYDGATALADAALMARHITKRTRFVVSPHLHPHYIDTLATYNAGLQTRIDKVPYAYHFAVDLVRLEAELEKGDVAAVVLPLVNFFGCFEAGLESVAEIAHRKGALLIVAIADPFVLALAKSPGEIGADIAIGEGQALGLPVGYGGPLLGFIAARMANARQMPGRIVGRTTDEHGKTAYVLTLQAREQHIRREKATSNICTNEALMALTATVYLGAIGGAGFDTIAHACLNNAHYAYERLTQIPKVSAPFATSKFFDEFVLKIDVRDFERLYRNLTETGFLPGWRLDDAHGTLGLKGELNFKKCLLLAFTDMNTKESIDAFTDALAKEAAHA